LIKTKYKIICLFIYVDYVMDDDAFSDMIARSYDINNDKPKKLSTSQIILLFVMFVTMLYLVVSYSCYYTS